VAFAAWQVTVELAAQAFFFRLFFQVRCGKFSAPEVLGA
jgi:hypothetical protein